MQPWTDDVTTFMVDELGIDAGLVDLTRRVIYPSLVQGDFKSWYNIYRLKTNRTRQIEAPLHELKTLQTELMYRFWYKSPPSDAAHGFIRGRSPVTNAKAHKYSDDCVVLSIDITAFFQSTKKFRIAKAAHYILRRSFPNQSKRLTIQLTGIITQLCMIYNWLPTGSPCSPAITNVIMKKFDRLALNYCSQRRAHSTYTRYADDIVVVTTTPDLWERWLRWKLKDFGYRINERKTKIMRQGRRQNVTGTVVNSGEPTISRRQRRKLRAKLHHKRKLMELGPKSSERRRYRDTRFDKLIGMASWIASVNDNDSHQRLLREAKELKLGKHTLSHAVVRRS